MENSIRVCIRLLKGCITMKSLSDGKQVHCHIQESGLESNIILGGILIDMYAKCGSLLDAQVVFDKMPEHNVYSWTAIISAYSKQQQAETAIDLYVKMTESGVKPDKFAFLFALKSCASLAELEKGRQIHHQIIESKSSSDVLVENGLIDMYAKTGSIEDTWVEFSRTETPDVVSWNATIAGYCQQGLCEEAIRLFDRMQHECMMPDDVTLISVTKACSDKLTLMLGKKVHVLILAQSLVTNVSVTNALLYMYSQCGMVEDVHLFFNDVPIKDVVSWTVLITSYVQQGLCSEAVMLFSHMQESGMIPSSVTLISILKAFASQGILELGREIHAYVLEAGLQLDELATSTLIDMYAKCGKLEDAQEVFSKMSKHNVVSWTVLIIAYAQQGPGQQALTSFEQMQQEGLKPNDVTFIGILKMRANLAALEWGQQVHDQILNGGFEPDVLVENTLVDIYAKCGSMKDAHRMFNCMCNVNIVSWNVMIGGYAQQGLGKDALNLFEQMILVGTFPNEVTFRAVLHACDYEGFLDVGWHQFVSMFKEHGFFPTEEHLGCMVDLLGRTGCLHQAYEFITRIPLQTDAVVWIALLSACKNHNNVKLGRIVCEFVLEMQPNSAAVHLLLSNIFSMASNWNEDVNIAELPKMCGNECS